MKKRMCLTLLVILCLCYSVSLGEAAIHAPAAEPTAEPYAAPAAETTADPAGLTPFQTAEPIAAPTEAPTPKPARWTYAIPLKELQAGFAVLVDEDHPMAEDEIPSQLVKATNVKRAQSTAIQVQATVLTALQRMFDAASEEEITLYLKKGYISYGQQRSIYMNTLARNGNVDDGREDMPGTSEYQTGLSVEIVNADYRSVAPAATFEETKSGRELLKAGDEKKFEKEKTKWLKNSDAKAFEKSEEGEWLAQHCAEYGFIMRYPSGETCEQETGHSYAPWCYRYVGAAIAQYISENAMTLESFTSEAEAALEAYAAAGGDVGETVRLTEKKAEPVTRAVTFVSQTSNLVMREETDEEGTDEGEGEEGEPAEEGEAEPEKETKKEKRVLPPLVVYDEIPADSDPGDSYLMNEYDETGDAEVSLVY